MDNTTLNKWRKFVDEHKPTCPCFDPEVAATLLANQETAERKRKLAGLVTPVPEKPKTFGQLVRSHFGKPVKRKRP